MPRFHVRTRIKGDLADITEHYPKFLVWQYYHLVLLWRRSLKGNSLNIVERKCKWPNHLSYERSPTKIIDALLCQSKVWIPTGLRPPANSAKFKKQTAEVNRREYGRFTLKAREKSIKKFVYNINHLRLLALSVVFSWSSMKIACSQRTQTGSWAQRISLYKRLLNEVGWKKRLKFRLWTGIFSKAPNQRTSSGYPKSWF